MGQIYCIRNKINGKCYVGQTRGTFTRRYPGGWVKRTKNPILKNSVRKYGIESFELSVLDDAPNHKLNELELKRAEELNCYAPHGYNIRKCGDVPVWIVPRSEEFRSRVSAQHKGKKISDKQKAALSRPVICSNGAVYPSTIEAARQLGLRQGHISEAANGIRRFVGPYTFSFSLDQVPVGRL